MTRRSIALLYRRLLNALRKLRAGLTLFGENISPEVPNDLYVAHFSVYQFAAQFCVGRRVLDLGSGAGYGSDYLRKQGAGSVTSVDIDRRNVRYARRKYSSPGIAFVQGDAQNLDTSLGVFGLVIASNVLEHLHDVTPALDALQQMVEPGGRMVIAVPPIFDDASLRENEAIPYHRSNYRIEKWLEMLDARFRSVDCYRLDVRPGVAPDFGNPFPSRLKTDDFVYERIPREDLLARPTISAIFVATR